MYFDKVQNLVIIQLWRQSFVSSMNFFRSFSVYLMLQVLAKFRFIYSYTGLKSRRGDFHSTSLHAVQKRIRNSIGDHKNRKGSRESSSSSALTTEETFQVVERAVQQHSSSMIEGLKSKGYAVIDSFLPLATLPSAMRLEAAHLYASNHMTLSQSTRYDPKTSSVIAYNKHNVYSLQLPGGELYYSSPRLHEYCVAMVKSVVPVLSSAFPESNLCPVFVSNKLAVCIGEGSAYDKHYDNSGLDDRRKITILIYLNPSWTKEQGGCFRIYHSLEEYTDIEPIMNRVLIFWSDRLVHSVQPSFAPRGEEDHRYALTLWLTSKSVENIARDDEEVTRHFGSSLR